MPSKSESQSQDYSAMIELTKRAKERNKRSEDFETFYKCSKGIFESFRTKGEREKYFESLYKLCICPGSRMGGHESRVVEMFWGNRVFDKNEGVGIDGRRTIHFESESGASMFFFKNDDGYVSIQLYPAHTEHSRPIEDFIFWKLRVAPTNLLSKCFQKCCWNAFMAYMEVTSLDGAPSIWQRLYVWYLRNFKRVVDDKKIIPVRFYSFLRNVGTWALTVGCSGLVIFLLQLWLSPNPSEHQNIHDIKKAAERTENVIESFQNELLLIKANQDTLIHAVKKIQKPRGQVKARKTQK